MQDTIAHQIAQFPMPCYALLCHLLHTYQHGSLVSPAPRYVSQGVASAAKDKCGQVERAHIVHALAYIDQKNGMDWTS